MIELKTKENHSLEYKVKPWEEKNKNPSHEAAKDISAFANTQGGTIIIGIEERAVESGQSKIPVNLKPFEIGNWEAKIDDINYTSIKPSIEGLHRYSISSSEPGKDYLVIDIPESPNAPHMDASTNRYYRRDNTGAKPMSEAEVAALYERRQAQQKRMEEYYAPLFTKLKEEQAKVGENEVQPFFLFLPRTFKEERFLLYDKDNEAALIKVFNAHQRYPKDFERVEEFRHFFTGMPGDYRSDRTNVWIHPSGGILIIGIGLNNEGSRDFLIPKDYAWFVELWFSLAYKICTQLTEEILDFTILFTFIGAGPWYINNFLEYYPDRWSDFERLQFYNPYHFRGEQPRNGEPNITIKRNISLDQIEGKALEEFLKKDFFPELLKKFGH